MEKQGPYREGAYHKASFILSPEVNLCQEASLSLLPQTPKHLLLENPEGLVGPSPSVKTAWLSEY